MSMQRQQLQLLIMTTKPEKEAFSTDIVNSGPNADSFCVSVKVKPSLPDFRSTVNLKYVKLGYYYLIGHGFYLLTVPIAAVIVGAELGRQVRWESEDGGGSGCDLVEVVLVVAMVGLVFCTWVGFTPRTTYLLDFACYRPPNDLKISKKKFIDLATKSGDFSAAAIDFQKRVLSNSGIGDETYMPTAVFKPNYKLTLRDGREEAAMSMFGAISDLLALTNIRPTDVKILVVNCGVLNTTPSLSSMVVNHFKMRNDIQSFNLGGMGCAAGIVAIDLANDLLSAYPGSYAIVVSTEAVTHTWYKGDDFDMLLPNCFFRMGAAALLLSNGRRDWWRAKYELKQVVRIHKGMDDRSFKSIRQREDTRGRRGISVSSDAMEVAADALRDNISTLAALLHVGSAVLSERLHFLTNKKKQATTKLLLPNCDLAFEHVCVLAASRRVLDEVKDELGMAEEAMEASRKTLERFGNTSSSSVWYGLAYLEANGKIKARDLLLQIAFGAGFKCNSLVLKALTTPTKPRLSPWL